MTDAREAPNRHTIVGGTIVHDVFAETFSIRVNNR